MMVTLRQKTAGSKFLPVSCHQINFNPNCSWRDVVEVLVIAPAVPDVFVPDVDEVKVIRFGVLKFARLSRLKISARN